MSPHFTFHTYNQKSSTHETEGNVAMTMTERPEEVIRADHVSGPQQGEWTYSHYLAIPDDGQRYEIIDGVLYMAPSPNEYHQVASNMIAYYLTAYVKVAGLGQVLTAPFDVKLSFKTVVQPDVLVFLYKRGQVEKLSTVVKRIPDVAVEIVSPGTLKHDRQRKFHAYEQAGIREYWIVEPKRRSVEVYALENGAYCQTGVFSGEQTIISQVVPDFPVAVQQFFE
jgi:Uma2 family endonuclease